MSSHKDRLRPRAAMDAGSIALVVILVLAVGGGLWWAGSLAQAAPESATPNRTNAAARIPLLTEVGKIGSKNVTDPETIEPPSAGGNLDAKTQRMLRRQAEIAAGGLGAGEAAFRVASLNLLGHSHTVGKGRGGRFASGPTRMRYSMDLLTSAGVDVVGFQEFQPQQVAMFNSIAAGWSTYGSEIGRFGQANSIAWRTDTWELVEGHGLSVPYFGGRPWPMPYVLLRHLKSEREVWFLNVHNPADAHGPAQHWRNAAVAKEAELINQLSADGTPVVLTGDMNDRQEFFCGLVLRASVHSADGAQGSPCRVPRRMNVDWIVGTTDLKFSGFVKLDGGLVDRATDHPLVISDVTVPAD